MQFYSTCQFFSGCPQIRKFFSFMKQDRIFIPSSKSIYSYHRIQFSFEETVLQVPPGETGEGCRGEKHGDAY